MKAFSRGLMAVGVVAATLGAGAAAFSSNVTTTSSPTHQAVCTAIRGNFDFLERKAPGPAIHALIESREDAALKLNGCNDPDD